MINSCCAEQVFNVYYAPDDIAIYLELFWAKEITWKSLDREQCNEELEKMKFLTAEIHELDRAFMRSPSLKEDTKNEIGSMVSTSMHLTLRLL